MIESQSMTQRAIGELTEFNEMIQAVIPYGQLTVSVDGIGKVEEAHKAVKRLSASIEKKRKELKAGALEYGRTVDSIAKQLSEKVDGVESKLKAERDAFDAIEKAEKAAKEAEKQAAKQARLNAMVAAGIPVDLVAADLPQEEWMWWLSKATKEAEARQARIEAEYAEEKRLAEEHAAKLEAERQRQAEELRIRSEEMERQRLQDEQRLQAERRKLQAEREEMEAKMDEQRKAAEAEREELRRQQEDIRKAEQAKLEEQQAEERKRREDAARPELERLDNIMQAMLKHGESLMVPLPWWAGEFAHRWNQLQESMRPFVREGEGT